MNVDCVVIDAGSRYGLHPTWVQLRGIAEFHLFEMDADEAQRLRHKYRHDEGIQIYPIALYSSDTQLRFQVTEHRGLNSVLQVDSDVLRRNEYMQNEFTVTEERTVEARSIDSLFAGREVHFFKLDVEGAELEVLEGAREQLSRNVLGVRSEVLFAPIYKDAALFGDLNRLLFDRGFELLNLDYTGAGNKTGRFTKPGRFGKLLSSDAVWVVSDDRLFAAEGDRLGGDVIRLALFMLLNGATDLAVDLLLRAKERRGVSYDRYGDAPLFAALNKQVLLLFKDLLALPMLSSADVLATYKSIFGRDFPSLNRFYEDPMFT
jgi:FkbM family methyltransferase